MAGHQQESTASRLRLLRKVYVPLTEITNCAGASGANERIAFHSGSSPPLYKMKG
jgi:hypothetical protein